MHTCNHDDHPISMNVQVTYSWTDFPNQQMDLLVVRLLKLRSNPIFAVTKILRSVCLLSHPNRNKPGFDWSRAKTAKHTKFGWNHLLQTDAESAIFLSFSMRSKGSQNVSLASATTWCYCAVTVNTFLNSITWNIKELRWVSSVVSMQQFHQTGVKYSQTV